MQTIYLNFIYLISPVNMLATAGLGEESVEAEIRQKIDTTSKFNHFKKFNSTSRKHLHFLFLILQINVGAILLHLPSHLSLGMFNNNIPIIWSHCLALLSDHHHIRKVHNIISVPVVPLPDGVIAWHLSVRMDSVLKAVELPVLIFIKFSDSAEFGAFLRRYKFCAF